VGIGGALAEARTEAGLTIAQVSERTRIRETIIRGIEQDDYSACGGDYYARGHIRAIARVVGTDPVPLIKEYDAARMPPPEVEPADWDDGRGRRLPGWHRTGDTQGVTGNTQGGSQQSGITAAEAFRPWMSLEPRRALPWRTGALALILLAVIGVLSYLLASGGSSPRPSLVSHRHAAHHPTGPGVAAQPSNTAAPAVALTPISAAAFGPGGVGQGDNSQQAPFAIDGSDSTAWQTDWYATANFDGSQPGTGLLLDLGKRVTVTSARILLGSAAGGRLELRAGNTPSLADLQVVARAHLSGGALTVPITSPVRARYLLIWFTRLPLDTSGTYQASIFNVSLSGTT
jgi:transcriptional regulator with XRE-family HTH domain